MISSTFPSWRTNLLVPVLLALGSVAIARLLVDSPALGLDMGEMLLLVAAILALVALVLLGPVICLAGTVGFTIAGGSLPGLGTVGNVDLGVADVLFAALVAWWVARAAHRSELGAPRRRRGELAFAQGPALAFLAFTGLTLLKPSVADAGDFDATVVSWLSFVQTIALAWLAATFLRSERDVQLVLWVVALATIGAIVPAVIEGGFSEREAGILDPTALGLASGLLVLMTFFGPTTENLAVRFAFLVFGCAGLAQAGSVGALVGTSLAVITGLTLSRIAARPEPRVPGRGGFRAVVIVLALTLAGGAAVVTTQLVRPEQLPFSDSFRTSSAYNRAILGSAGLEIAKDNPIIGVGWRQSSEPAIIGDPDVNESLRAQFRYAKPTFYPDVQPASVHNAYIQIAAEFGLIGLGLFLFALVTVGLSVKRVLVRIEPGTSTWRIAWYLAFGLVLVLVWLNDNPLFGGQIETVMPALFVGALAAIGRMVESAAQAEPETTSS